MHVLTKEKNRKVIACLDYCYHRLAKHKHCGISGAVSVDEVDQIRRLFWEHPKTNYLPKRTFKRGNIMHELTEKLFQQFQKKRGYCMEDIEEVIVPYLKEKARDLKGLISRYKYMPSEELNVDIILKLSEKSLEEKFEKHRNKETGDIQASSAALAKIAKEHFRKE